MEGAAAIKRFRLSDEQRKRLVLTELPWRWQG
jgi:hypothetical protein